MSKSNCNNNVKKYESKNGQTTFIKDNVTGKKWFNQNLVNLISQIIKSLRNNNLSFKINLLGT